MNDLNDQFTVGSYTQMDLASYNPINVANTWRSSGSISTFKVTPVPEVFETSKLLSLDIETKIVEEKYKYPNGTYSNHVGGLDARTSQITSIAVSASDGTTFYVDSPSNEKFLLNTFANYLNNDFYSSVFVGWNIFFFDAPWLAYRMNNVYKLTRPNPNIPYVSLGRTGAPRQPEFEAKYGLPEWAAEICDEGKWNYIRLAGVPVYDISPYFKKYADEKGIRCSLKEVAKSFGLKPVEIDIMKIDSLSSQEKMAYNMSDTQAVLDLVKIGLEEGLFS